VGCCFTTPRNGFALDVAAFRSELRQAVANGGLFVGRHGRTMPQSARSVQRLIGKSPRSSAYAAALSRKSAHRSPRLRVARDVRTALLCGERAPRHALPTRDQNARQRLSGHETIHVHAPLPQASRAAPRADRAGESRYRSFARTHRS